MCLLRLDVTWSKSIKYPKKNEYINIGMYIQKKYAIDNGKRQTDIMNVLSRLGILAICPCWIPNLVRFHIDRAEIRSRALISTR